MIQYNLLAGTTLSSTLIAIVLLAALSYGIASFLRKPYAENVAKLKGPSIKHWFWGSWPKSAYISGKYEYNLLKTIEEHGPICTFVEMGRTPVIVLGDHRAATKVLLQTPYQRVPMINDIIRRHAGAGLLTVEGAQHRRQRKVAHPAFTQTSVYKMAPTMHEKSQHLVKRLQRHIAFDHDTDKLENGSRIDISKDIFSAALDIIGAVGFDYQFNSLLGSGEHSALEKAFHDCLHLLTTGTIYNGLRTVWGAPVEKLGRLLGVKEQLALDRSKKLVREISSELVDRAKSAGSSGTDLLTLMVRANTSDEVKESQRLSDAELSEIVPVFLFAGHETTATALSWAMLALTDQLRGAILQKRLREELLGDELWKDDAAYLDSLPYVDAFCREVLRLYCPVRNLPRQAPCDDVIPLSRPFQQRDGSMAAEVRVRKGQVVQFPISWMNRDRSLWGQDGDQFIPERWLPSDHDYAKPQDQLFDPCVSDLKGVWSNLMSFGAGPQMCIGVKMAVFELKVMLAHIITQIEVLAPNLAHEPPVEIESADMIVSKPTLKGELEQGLAMPVRIRRFDI